MQKIPECSKTVSIKNALSETKRVLKYKGRLVVMVWGNKEDCEAASYLKAVGSLLPPPLSGAPGPFAFSENQLLEKTLEEACFTILDNTDVVSVCHAVYHNKFRIVSKNSSFPLKNNQRPYTRLLRQVKRSQ